MRPELDGMRRPTAGRSPDSPRREANGMSPDRWQPFAPEAGVRSCRFAGGQSCGSGGSPEPCGEFPRIDERFTRAVLPVLGRMVRVSRRILESDDLAWDAVQEALLSFWLQDVPPADRRGWLIRATVHRSLHLARAIRRRRSHEARSCLARPEASDSDDPARRAEAAEARAGVLDALAGLREPHRLILALHLIEGLGYEAIAERLGTSLGTVKSRLSRARAALRRALDAEFGADPTPPDPERPDRARSDGP